MWILVHERETSLEVFLALWLIRRFEQPGLQSFKNARVTYFASSIPPDPGDPARVWVLTASCLAGEAKEQLMRRLYVPPVSLGTVYQYVREAQYYQNRTLVAKTSESWLAAGKPLTKFIQKLFRVFDEGLAERRRLARRRVRAI